MKLPQVPETDVYVNANGHLVIKQDQYPEEPVFVVLPKAYALAVVDLIKLLIESGELVDFAESEDA